MNNATRLERTQDVESYASGEAIPNLGHATGDSASTCDEFLVLLKATPVQVRARRGTDGTLRYLVDQLVNLNSISCSSGGIFAATKPRGTCAASRRSHTVGASDEPRARR